MIGALDSALSGIRVADDVLASAAGNIANVNTENYQQSPRPEAVASVAPGSANNVDIAGQMAAMIVAGAMMKANVTTARTAVAAYDEVLKLRVNATSKQGQ